MVELRRCYIRTIKEVKIDFQPVVILMYRVRFDKDSLIVGRGAARDTEELAGLELAAVAAEDLELAAVAAEDLELAAVAAEDLELAAVAAEDHQLAAVAAEDLELAAVAAEDLELAAVAAEDLELDRLQLAQRHRWSNDVDSAVGNGLSAQVYGCNKNVRGVIAKPPVVGLCATRGVAKRRIG